MYETHFFHTHISRNYFLQQRRVRQNRMIVKIALHIINLYNILSKLEKTNTTL